MFRLNLTMCHGGAMFMGYVLSYMYSSLRCSSINIHTCSGITAIIIHLSVFLYINFAIYIVVAVFWDLLCLESPSDPTIQFRSHSRWWRHHHVCNRWFTTTWVLFSISTLRWYHRWPSLCRDVSPPCVSYVLCPMMSFGRWLLPWSSLALIMELPLSPESPPDLSTISSRFLLLPPEWSSTCANVIMWQWPQTAPLLSSDWENRFQACCYSMSVWYRPGTLVTWLRLHRRFAISIALPFVVFNIADRSVTLNFHHRRQSWCSRRRQELAPPSSGHAGSVSGTLLETTDDRAVQ